MLIKVIVNFQVNLGLKSNYLQFKSFIQVNKLNILSLACFNILSSREVFGFEYYVKNQVLNKKVH